MKKLSFPTVKLGKFIREVKEKVKNSDLSQENFTVYGVTNTDGITVTNNKASDDLSNYTVLRENQFAYNPYRVNVGSIGLSSPGTFGAVSPAYIVFETNGQINNEFLLYYLKSSLGINLIKWYGDRGGVRSALRFSDLKKIDFPHITLEQQNKLLIKIKRLDELLGDMNKNLSVDKIAALRQSILQQAVEGKLCEQDPNDEPVSVLLEKIKAEKKRLIAEKKIKKQKPLPPIKEEEKPFNLPNGWEWCRLGDICDISDGTHQTPTYTDDGVPFMSAQNVKPFKFMSNRFRMVSKLDYEQYIKNTKPEKGDILMARVGAGIGEAAIIDVELDFAIYVSLCLIKPVLRIFDMNYLLLWLNGSYGRDSSKKNTLGKGTSQGNLNLNLIRGFCIPFPPIREQHRIVEKANTLTSLCDTLETEIKQAQNHASQLMEAVLQEAFSNKENKKAAQVIKFHPNHKEAETELLAAARGNIREDTWEHLRKRALEISGEES